ncbi:MAG: glycoside hydrolase family 105 protein [Candidatus Thorarchaeota archaeon]
MKKFIIFLLLINLGININAGMITSDLKIIQLVADNILSNTTYTIIDKENKESYTSSKNLPTDKEFKIESPYVEWKYWNGVLNIAMLELSKITAEEKYKQYSIKNYQFVFENLDFFKALYKSGIENTGMEKFFEMRMLDDCGAMGAGLIEVYWINKEKRYREYIDKVANYIMKEEHRLEDGTLARLGPYEKTVWLDDLYMSIPFIARYGKLTGDIKYFQFATKQVIQFTKYLYDEYMGLYFHCYYDNIKENGVAHWGRANGWSIMAQANLLDVIPKDYPERDTLLDIYRQQIIGLSRYQSESGLWHQILDKTDSYLETSCSAMFTYAIAKGVNEGWLEEDFKTVALKGWEGIKTKIQLDGQVKDICVGTWIQNDLVFYYKRPTELNDIHGLGAVILAGVEILKLQ